MALCSVETATSASNCNNDCDSSLRNELLKYCYSDKLSEANLYPVFLKSFAKSNQVSENYNVCIDKTESKNQSAQCKKNHFPCGLCYRTFIHEKTRDIHQTRHIGTQLFCCNMCQAAYFTQRSLLLHKQKEHIGSKLYKCKYCFDLFIVKSELIKHLRKHTGERPFKCEVCEKTFSIKSCLIKHIEIHKGKKFFKCDLCDKSFFRKRLAVQHRKTTHVGILPFKCEFCEKYFDKKTIYLRHKLKHSRQDSFECEVCGKSVSMKSSLARHMKSHIFDVSDMSNGKFFTKIELTKRNQDSNASAGAFTCEICHKSFARKFYLIQHLPTHSGTKAFTCKLCKSAFTRKSGLMLHMKLHKNLKLFECENCAKCFNHQVSLKRHQKQYCKGKSTSDELNEDTLYQKPFCCEKCNECFHFRTCLKRHQILCFGDKSIVKNELNRGIDVHLSATNNLRNETELKDFAPLKLTSSCKNFSCFVCSQTYVSKSLLTEHVKMHLEKKKL